MNVCQSLAKAEPVFELTLHLVHSYEEVRRRLQARLNRFCERQSGSKRRDVTAWENSSTSIQSQSCNVT
jgi:hypothetical protein